MTLVESDGVTVVMTLCKETYVACGVDRINNKLKVILHHQINANPYNYGDHTYIVDLDKNEKQFNVFKHWAPCPLNEYTNVSFILVNR